MEWFRALGGVWLGIAFLLGLAEMVSLDLILIMLAVGALAGMILASSAPASRPRCWSPRGPPSPCSPWSARA